MATGTMSRWRPAAGAAPRARLAGRALRTGPAAAAGHLVPARVRRDQRPARRPGWTATRCAALPATNVRADLHCVTKWTVRDLEWIGRRDRRRCCAPCRRPKTSTHVMVWAEYGYSANLPLDGVRRAGHAARHPCRGRAAHTRARLPAAAGLPVAVRLEVGQVGARGGVPRRRPARLLGGARLPQRRRPLAATSGTPTRSEQA